MPGPGGYINRRRKAMRRRSRAENPYPRVRMRQKDYEKKGRKKHRFSHLYGSKEWRLLRARHINENPVCCLCGLLANQVDHKVRHRGDVKLFFDPLNLQSLCKRCHQKKTAAERRGWRPNSG